MQTMPVGISPESSMKPALSSLPSDVRATALAHWRGAASRPHGYAKCGRGLASGLPAEKVRGADNVLARAFPAQHAERRGIGDKLNTEINAGLADPKIKARLADLGGTVLPGSPADFGKLIADETEKWGKVIRAANIKAD